MQSLSSPRIRRPYITVWLLIFYCIQDLPYKDRREQFFGPELMYITSNSLVVDLLLYTRFALQRSQRAVFWSGVNVFNFQHMFFLFFF